MPVRIVSLSTIRTEILDMRPNHPSIKICFIRYSPIPKRFSHLLSPSIPKAKSIRIFKSCKFAPFINIVTCFTSRCSCEFRRRISTVFFNRSDKLFLFVGYRFISPIVHLLSFLLFLWPRSQSAYGRQDLPGHFSVLAFRHFSQGLMCLSPDNMRGRRAAPLCSRFR